MTLTSALFAATFPISTNDDYIRLLGGILLVFLVYGIYLVFRGIRASKPVDSPVMDKLVDESPVMEEPLYEIYRDVSVSEPLSPVEEEPTNDSEIKMTEELLSDVKETIKSEEKISKPKLRKKKVEEEKTENLVIEKPKKKSPPAKKQIKPKKDI